MTRRALSLCPGSISARAAIGHTFTGIAVSLKGLLSDDDNYVRCLTAQALTILAGKEILLVLL